MESIRLWEKDTPLFREDYKGEYNQEPPALKPFLVEEKGRGAVIVCPGGGYTMRADHEGDPVAEAINRAGVNAFVLSYRVAPYQYPAMLLDAQRAIRLLRANADKYGIDPNHIGILGFSAGGHLCSMAATHYDAGDPQAEDPIDRISCRPDAFMPCYGAISFHKYFHYGSMLALTGKETLEPPESRFFSAEYNVTADTPPAFLWHTAQDEAVPVENSIYLALALGDKGIPYALHIFPFGQHGIGLAEDNRLASAWPGLLGEWLNETGF